MKKIILSISVINLIILISCSSKVNSIIDNEKITAVVETEYSDSIQDFKDSIENITEEKFEFKKIESKYIEYNIEELENSIEENDLGSIIEIKKDKNITKYYFKINLDNYEKADSIFPAINNEKVSVYLAKYNIDETEEDYLDMIEFVFGEDLKEDLIKSNIDIYFSTDKTFSDLKNCYIEDGKIKKSFRLLDFLLLKTPIEFSFCVS